MNRLIKLSIIVLLSGWVHLLFADEEGQWQRMKRGMLPDNPMPVDMLTPVDSKRWYVCRAHYNKAMHPGKLSQQSRACLITVSGRTNRAPHYEVLLKQADYIWQAYQTGPIPENAVIGGAEDADEAYLLYICRVQRKKAWVAGKILKPGTGCQIERNGRAYTMRKFEILVKKAKD
ncbi:DM9 repeat-containing protein [Candidatus Venteria ishoeyi]|uniref:Uncharacterized protein n=1 Tax=Candidatus Venteria ishoeyi TaxID=1899563 RepID=A0A1H6FCB1_9GAMM|nr:DM9 repeat-containing protein [Candidatus Venteria ishoeyi]MDM8545375.1 DUF3421 domain-containing protein [Candidatus Venteria ishoeyi]SEH07263.1 Uncharacterised protein [Candidatus Venteria ishoeyi]